MNGVGGQIVNGVDEVVVNSLIEPYNSEQTPYQEISFDSRLKKCLDSNVGSYSGPLKVLKFVLVGDLAVGKTSLIQRFCHKTFEHDYKPTIGCDFEIEKFTILHQPITVQFWDTAGQERFRCIASAYYRNAQCIILSFDLTKVETLLNCSSWLNDALKVNSNNRPLIFLVGNKKDCLNGYEYEKVEELALNMASQLQAEYWPASSKTGENVHRIFTRAAALVFQKTMLADHPSLNSSAELSSQGKTPNGLNSITLPTKRVSQPTSPVEISGRPKKECCSLL